MSLRSRSKARSPRPRWRRVVMIVAAVALVTATVLAGHVGWFSRADPWQQATGWDEIPAELRPQTDTVNALAADPGDGPRIDWLGHSGFLVTWQGTRILLDPNLNDHCTISRRVLEPSVLPSDLGAVDAVLISHAHYDHLDLQTLEAIPSIGTVVLPAGSEGFIRGPRWEEVPFAGLDPGQRVRIGPLEVIAVPAAHNGNRFHPLASHYQAVGYVVRAGDDAIYYAGDTGFDNGFEEIGSRYRPHLAILPIGAFSPRIPMRYYHLSPEEAVAAARLLGVEVVIPCHFGTFALSLDRPSSALPRFAHAAHEQGLRWIMPPLLKQPPEARDGPEPAR